MNSHKSFPLVETERLLLREILLEDAADLFGYYNDRLVTQYLDWFGPSSVDHAKDIITNWSNQFQQGTFMRWGITLKEDKKVIGTILLAPVRGPFEWKLPLVIGYELSREYWNQGIMSEAVQAAIAFAFDELGNHRVCAEVFPENTASLRILKRLGFQEEGLLKKHLWHEGTKTWHDVITLAVLKNS
ncbi:N-acetyltransferase [Paenibacillus psychroresistens]|uniref:N-acetyltransferase n=1 Tax=Paenibacillus psychroresistens TaxID=1778678 RepID=A0A6B8RE63_9BACL|nr:GNAT family N-acetyltransferase [Paenibacillus psychroresistens]QGQ93825.1 N-acetyltransferase [Paenibacillus psychroresistens]